MRLRYVLMVIFVFAIAGAITANYFKPELKDMGQLLKDKAIQAGTPNSIIGKPMQAFTLNNLQGEATSSSLWANKILLINFWASWCPPCRREIPGFADVYEFYQDSGFVVIGIALDKQTAVEKFLNDMPNVNYPQLIGASDGARVARTFANTSGRLPYSALVDRNGIIRFVQYGELKKPLLIEKLEMLLAERA